MMSEMSNLSPQARAKFQALYPQMVQVMAGSHMMSSAGTPGSIMGRALTGKRPPTSGGQPSTT